MRVPFPNLRLLKHACMTLGSGIPERLYLLQQSAFQVDGVGPLVIPKNMSPTVTTGIELAYESGRANPGNHQINPPWSCPASSLASTKESRSNQLK